MRGLRGGGAKGSERVGQGWRSCAAGVGWVVCARGAAQNAGCCALLETVNLLLLGMGRHRALEWRFTRACPQLLRAGAATIARSAPCAGGTPRRDSSGSHPNALAPLPLPGCVGPCWRHPWGCLVPQSIAQGAGELPTQLCAAAATRRRQSPGRLKRLARSPREEQAACLTSAAAAAGTEAAAAAGSGAFPRGKAGTSSAAAAAMAPLQANPFFRAGLPMIVLMGGGFLGLRFFLQGRLDVQVRGEKGGFRKGVALAGASRDRPEEAQLIACFSSPFRPLASSARPSSLSPCLAPAAQDAQKKELDLRAPVSKQRAKRFNLEEELAVRRARGERRLPCRGRAERRVVCLAASAVRGRAFSRPPRRPPFLV